MSPMPIRSRRWSGRALEIFDGRIDILLNGAGGIIPPQGRPLVDLSVEDFERTLAANLNGCFLTMKFTLPAMIRQRSGRIVSIGGTFGLKGAENLSHYSAAKWGLIGLSRSVALEVGRHNVTVNVVCPGYVKSPVVMRELAARAAERGLHSRRGRSRHHREHGVAPDGGTG